MDEKVRICFSVITLFYISSQITTTKAGKDVRKISKCFFSGDTRWISFDCVLEFYFSM